MNLFFARIFGKLMNAEKAEKYNAQKLADAKRYREIEASETYKEYLALEREVSSTLFIAKKEELKASKEKGAWQGSDEAQKETRLAALKKTSGIAFMLNADIREIEEIESWKKVWETEFNDSNLEKNDMKAGFWFKQKGLKTNFSYIGEALAYMGEKNISIRNGILSILTKKERVSAPAWDAKQGFKMHDYMYTSAVVNSGDAFSQPIGKFIAKVRATGKCHSGVYLVGEDTFPVIELFHYNGKNLVVGLTDKNGSDREVIKGIKANDWMILTVNVNRQEIVWTLNNMEIHRAKNPLPGQSLHFTCLSFAPEGKAGESRFDIGYLKGYVK